MDIAPIIAELDRWPEPHRYRDAARPPVLFLQYSLVTGGAGYFVQRLADGLADRCTVDVTGMVGRPGAVARACRSAAVLPCEAAGLARHARWAGYDLVDAAWPLRDGHCDLIELVLAAAPRARLAVRCHSEACFLRHALTDRTRDLVRRADLVIFHHAAQRREVARLHELDADRCRIAPPGVDVRRFRPGGAGADPRAVAEYRRRYDLTDPATGRKRLVVAMAGRASEEKNWPDFLLVARALKDVYGDGLVCLAITGRQIGFPARRHLDRLARFSSDLGSPARITGLIDDLEAVYASVDVYVHTACSESLCRTAAEAQAAGVPVVALATGGLRVVVEDGRTGTIVERDRPAKWLARCTARERAGIVGAVRDLLDGPALRTAQGRAAARRARERLDDRRNTAWHRRAIGELIGCAL